MPKLHFNFHFNLIVMKVLQCVSSGKGINESYWVQGMDSMTDGLKHPIWTFLEVFLVWRTTWDIVMKHLSAYSFICFKLHTIYSTRKSHSYIFIKSSYRHFKQAWFYATLSLWDVYLFESLPPFFKGHQRLQMVCLFFMHIGTTTKESTTIFCYILSTPNAFIDTKTISFFQ